MIWFGTTKLQYETQNQGLLEATNIGLDNQLDQFLNTPKKLKMMYFLELKHSF